MSSIGLMIGAREKKEEKRKLVPYTSEINDSITTSLVEPKTTEGILDEKANLKENQRTSSLDLHLKMIEEQNQLEELAKEKALRLELEKQEAKERDEEQERRLEEESRRIQLELEQAQKERLIIENERLRLLAAQDEREKAKNIRGRKDKSRTKRETTTTNFG